VVGVWVGNTDNRPMHEVSGVDGAGPIWRAVLAVATGGDPGDWPTPPAGVVQATVCSPTGLLPGPDCPSPVHEWFVTGSVPTNRETFFGRNAGGELTVDPPPEARAWALEAGLSLADGIAGDASGTAVHILQPSPGSVFYVSPELDDQVLMLKASFPPGAEEIEFRVDGAAAAQAPGSPTTALWALALGAHRVEAIAFLPGGQRAAAQTTFEVRAR